MRLEELKRKVAREAAEHKAYQDSFLQAQERSYRAGVREPLPEAIEEKARAQKKVFWPVVGTVVLMAVAIAAGYQRKKRRGRS